jgi:hypothetical protein
MKAQTLLLVDALRIRALGNDQWDEVVTFLGFFPGTLEFETGRNEDFTVRRPARGQNGFVRVTVHQAGKPIQGEAGPGDWLVRDRADNILIYNAADFETVYRAV